MNKIYKVKKNAAGHLVACSEFAKGHTKKAVLGSLLIVGALGMATTASAQQNNQKAASTLSSVVGSLISPTANTLPSVVVLITKPTAHTLPSVVAVITKPTARNQPSVVAITTQPKATTQRL